MLVPRIGCITGIQHHQTHQQTSRLRAPLWCNPCSQPTQRRHVQQATPLELAFVPAICFTKECQQQADQAFLLGLAVPLIVAAAAATYIFRPPPQDLQERGQLFEDESTGTLFQAPDSQAAQPERDKDGLLALRPVSYTPWPITVDCEGERLRIDVGPVKNRKPRTFVFNKLLPQPSEVVAITLPRPMGVVFEYTKARKQAVVAGVVEGSAADQKRKVAGLNPTLARETVLDGDVLRGATCTNFVYPTKALIGAVPPERHVVVYGADKQPWAKVRAALRKGEVKDGPVTLILERRVKNNW
eukprot:GHRR01002615.1.p1 GENE.GHRR01002615.1~~GHRR01002615.1.p1  ORF type:complete len:300 (+),score=51.45 GHRR01002615.1:96-995(+)